MKMELDCISCTVRQLMKTVRFVTEDPDLQRRVINKTFQFLEKASFEVPPPELASHIYRIIGDVTGNGDPYRKIKDEYNRSALRVYDELKSHIFESRDPFGTAARLAIAGNGIDYGTGQNPVSVRQVIEDMDTGEFHINHIDSLVRDLRQASKILYIADNAGEIVFDKLLIETIREFCTNGEVEITLVVRGKPVINDATMNDALDVGMDEVARVIDNGSDVPGTILKFSSSELRRCFEKSDLIISKGQGNYETLHAEEKLIYYLLIVKCPVTGGHLGATKGDFVLKCNRIPGTFPDTSQRKGESASRNNSRSKEG
jgi:uncharacterized protein with ATP-grasp and redox domains